MIMEPEATGRLPMNLDGVYSALVTAFDEAGELDLEGCRRSIEHNLAGGVQGIIPAGTTGEYYALSEAERLRLFDHTRDVVGDRARLIAGCNSGATREVIRYATAARELGYEAILLSVPHTSLPSQGELAAHYREIAGAVGLPIVLYNFPARSGVELGFECLDALVDVPEVVAMKEASSDFSRFLALRERYGERYQLCCGSDDQALDYFFWGVTSWIAGGANVLPRHHVALLEAAVRGDWHEARRLWQGLLPWVQHMESGRYTQKAKLGMEVQGVRVGAVRAPLRPIASDEAADYRRVLEAARATPLPAGTAAELIVR